MNVAEDAVEISFEISAATDVAVTIVDKEGAIVRHLAAGLLGKNAPEPLQRNSLQQKLNWNLRNDAGQPVNSSGLSVKIAVGSHAKLEKPLGYDGNALLGQILSLKMSPKGELFVLLADPFRGRSELRVLNSQGKFQRTIFPYAADTPPQRSKPFGHFMLNGKRQPIVSNGQAHAFHPLTAGLREQTMAWHPDGYLILASAIGSMANHGPPRYLMAFDPNGGSPENISHLGPKVRNAAGFLGGAGEGHSTGLDRIALSPDGKTIYFVQNMSGSWRFAKQVRHGVYRLKWTDEQARELWLGGDEPGSGENQFNEPAGLAVDAQGRLYVCDRGNNRVVVYNDQGDRLGEFACPLPEQIEVHPKSGEIVVLSKANEKRAKLGVLLRFSPWSSSPPQQLAKLEVEGLKFMTLEPTSAALKLWIVQKTGYQKPEALRPVALEEGSFVIGDNVNQVNALHYPSFVAADPARNRVLVFEHLNGYARGGHRSIDLKTGEVSQVKSVGSDLALDQHGNIYTTDPYNANSISRYAPDFTPLSFPKTKTHKIELTYRAYGPSMGLRGHCIAPNGDLYVRRSPNHAKIAVVDVFSPTGELKHEGLIRGAGSADSGIGVDTAGNVYLGMNLKPADEILPDDFTPHIPIEAWRYYQKADQRKAPWSLIYANPYLAHMGSVFKFGPQGGTIFGNASEKELQANPDMRADKAPDSAASLKSAYLKWNVKVAGAKWRYPGVGVIPASFDAFRGDDGCSCLVSQLDTDPFGRTFAPSAFYSSVEMIDSAGNRIARIGEYGNADDVQASDGAIAFAWPTVCDYCPIDGKLYVSDSVNRQVLVIGFSYADEKTVAIK